MCGLFVLSVIFLLLSPRPVFPSGSLKFYHCSQSACRSQRRGKVSDRLSAGCTSNIYICIFFFNPSILSGCQPISLSAPTDTSVFWHKIPKGFLFLFRPLYLSCCLLVCLAAAAPSSLFSLSVSVYKFSKDWKKEALLTFTWSSKWSCN